MMVLLIALASAAVYAWRRTWVDAVLVLVAGAALFALTQRGDIIRTDDPAPAVMVITDDGLRAAQWQDLPARPLQWSLPTSPALRLEFPRELALGRTFTLTMRFGQTTRGRLQLLAENGEVIAETPVAGHEASVQWLPAVAERLVLRARLLDQAGKLRAEGPVPLLIREPLAMKVAGRFAAPSFDVRALNELLVQSGALLDWQVTLGKASSRSETARETFEQPDLFIVDAAWFEHAAAPARAALLGQVAGGVPLLVLGGDAAAAQTWSHELGLQLVPAKDAGDPLAARAQGPWRVAAPGLLTRAWKAGRISWLAAADWHRRAITAPRELAQWWQTIIDAAGVRRAAPLAFLPPAEMPLPGQRAEICALGASGEVQVQGQALRWQPRAERADARCVAVWPQRPGWMDVQGGALYVYAPTDWPQWQAAERRDATAVYAARTPAPQNAGQRTLPAWPFALTFMLAMLGLWWRERR